MVKIVFMYKLKEGVDPDQFEKWFYKVHLPDVMRYPKIRKYVVNKVIGAPNEDPKYNRTVELHFESLSNAECAWKWRKENILTKKGHSPLEWIEIGPIVYCEGEEFSPLVHGEETDISELRKFKVGHPHPYPPPLRGREG